MDALHITGPARLSGEVPISGSKNACLPLLFSALLFDKEVEFRNVPRLWDVETTLKLLEAMGCEANWDKELGSVKILPRVQHKVAPYEWVKKMRAGILALGPLVARFGEAKVSLPGGCAIGARPVNYHLEAMRQMGVSIDVEDGYIKASVLGKIQGARIRFPEVSVTGTENILYVACLADGETVIENAAREPEVVALGLLLQSCGAKIAGLGTSTITVQGGPLSAPSKPVEIPADRIETGTWIAIAMATGNELILKNAAIDDSAAVFEAYRKMGLKLEMLGTQDLRVIPTGRYESIQVSTEPYPGFPTDMQAQLLANMCQVSGVSEISENIFENRFMHVAELRRLGAKIDIQGNTARVYGGTPLRAAPMMATDLRASASLVIAALMAKGTSSISRIYHLDRGYNRLDEKLRRLGAEVQRVAE